MLGKLAAAMGTGLAPFGGLDRDGRFCRWLFGGLFPGLENDIHHKRVGFVALAARTVKPTLQSLELLLELADPLLRLLLEIANFRELRAHPANRPGQFRVDLKGL